MSYLQALQQELRGLIEDLDEATQKEIARFVGKKVYESWQQGASTAKRSPRLTAPTPISNRQAND
jgi:hypothetical protein